MENEVVKKETAELAKSKKFWEYSDYAYFTYEKEGKTVTTLGSSNYPEYNYGEVLAPEQSLLQRWLREKHGIYIMITVAPLSGVIDFYYSIRYGENVSKFKSGEDPLTHNSYEEALETALVKALNLI